MSDLERREEQLIEEREEYERQYFEHIIDEMIESDELDKLIQDRMDYLENRYELDLANDAIIFNDADDSDLAEDYDEDFYNSFIAGVVEDEEQIKGLIDLHVRDEKQFLDSMIIEVIQEQDYFQKAIDEMVLDHFDIEYEPEDFDYRPDYWYEDNYVGDHWVEDESVKDPFDSFGEIDYPEGYVERDLEQFNMPEFDDFDFEPDFIEEEIPENHDAGLDGAYDGQIENMSPEVFVDKFDDIDEERDKRLIEEKEMIEELFKDYFTRDDILDKLIKEKLKEKKFNQ